MRTDTNEPTRLTNDELLTHVKDLVRRDRAHLVELLVHLGELDVRQAYLADGASSLFTWCTRVAHLGEAAAFTRIRAARAARRFPIILDRLARGAVHVHAVARLAPHLTVENHALLLDEATHAPRHVIDGVVARFQESVAPAARVVPQVAGTRKGSGNHGHRRAMAPKHDVEGDLFAIAPDGPASASTEHLEPTDTGPDMPAGPVTWRLHVTLSSGAHADLERLRELMRHQVPDGDPSIILARALALLREQVECRRLGRGRRSRSPRSSASARMAAAGHRSPNPRTSPSPRHHIPAAVRREVSRRDGDQCAFVTADGRRCAERAWLEFHHVLPRAGGGRATPGNLELRCRAHNRYDAERDFDGYVRETGPTYCGAGIELRSGAATAPRYGNPSG